MDFQGAPSLPSLLPTAQLQQQQQQRRPQIVLTTLFLLASRLDFRNGAGVGLIWPLTCGRK